MYRERMNIYSRCRKAAGLTQEKAAEVLDCGVRTLAAWEGGECLPPDNKVLMMCEIYGTPTLAVDHLRLSSGLAWILLPQVEGKPLAQAVLSLLRAIKAFNAAESDWSLMEIAEDGSISPEERKLFDKLLEQLEDIVEAAYALRLCREAIKKPADAEAPTGHIK